MKAIVIGSNGMDGSHMVDLLHDKNYEVFEIPYKLDKKELLCQIDSFQPDEIYNFAGYSNVFSPYADLQENIDSNLTLPKNVLEIIVEVNPKIKFFNASSCLVFGNDKSGCQNEDTPINPIHPYGVIKYAAQSLVKMFREDNGLFSCSAVFFPHESPRRKEGFFTKKITAAVKRIKNGSKEKIKVGDLTQMRDWGYAPEYVYAAYLMMQNKVPKDYVVGTGIITKTEDFVRMCFECVNLDYKNFIEHDDTIIRKDHGILKADYTEIEHDLGWMPIASVYDIIKVMLHD